MRCASDAVIAGRLNLLIRRIQDDGTVLPLSSIEKAGEAHHQSHVAPPNSATASSPASPASEVKACADDEDEGACVSCGKPGECEDNQGDPYCHACMDRRIVSLLSEEQHEALVACGWTPPSRRTPAPSPATGESAIDKALDPNCWDLAMQADTLAAARAELASLRAEVERLRTALAEKEKAGVDVSLVECLVASCERWARATPNDLIAMHESGTLERSCYSDAVKDLVPRIVALRTALGAKETK